MYTSFLLWIEMLNKCARGPVKGRGGGGGVWLVEQVGEVAHVKLVLWTQKSQFLKYIVVF